MGWLAEAWRPRHRGPGWPPGARLRAGRAWVLPPLIGWRLPSGRGGTGQPNVTGEAAGHYRRPLIMAGVCPGGWQVMEVNLAHVAARRRVNRRRGVKTGRVDLVAIADLLLAGRGCPVVAGEEPLIGLAAWVTHRRRDEVRTATKNQLLAQLERAFPGRGPGAASGWRARSRSGELPG